MSSPGESEAGPNKRQKVTKDPSGDDRQAELIAAVREESRLEAELATARARTKEARKRLRDAGEAEFDSLLFVGKDSLSHVLKFLDIKMLGRCEQTCKAVRSAADVAWKYYEEDHIGQLNTSKTCDDVRTRVNRFCMASSFVARVEEKNIWHGMEDYIRADRLGEKDNYCSRIFSSKSIIQSCPFPDELDDRLMDYPANMELFMRIRGSYPEKEILFEGFVPASNIESERRDEGNINRTLSINFRGLDFSRWPQMNCILSFQGDKANKQWERLNDDSLDIDAALIALPNSEKILSNRPLRAGLLCSNSSFEMWPEYDDKRFEACAEGCVATCPHHLVSNVIFNSCRFIRLVRDISGGDFVGWKVEDGEPPEYDI